MSRTRSLAMITLSYVVAIAVGWAWLWWGPGTGRLWLDTFIADVLATLVVFVFSPGVPQLELLRRLLERDPAAAAVLLVEPGGSGGRPAALLARRGGGGAVGGPADRQLGVRDFPGCTTRIGATRCSRSAPAGGSSSPTCSRSTSYPPCRCSSGCCRYTSR